MARRAATPRSREARGALSQQPSPLPRALREVIAAELGPGSRPLSLFGRFLASSAYSRPLALDLLDAAAGRAGDPWEIRRVAALLLQGQLLRIPPRDLAELELWLSRLELKAAGVDRVRESVLAEGYTTTEPRGFVRELRRRLSRARRVLDRLQESRTTPGALRDFLAYARQECKLDLARYLFHPEEVAERILSQVRTSRGMPSPFPEQPFHIREEAQRAFSALPDYEARILRRLGQGHRIFWVSDGTSSEINSLVEYPLTTVVLVVKPPGSALEFEIKRAGCRGDRLLGIVYERDGEPVPPSHRLAGGSMGTGLNYEARSSSLLARIYRAAHGAEAPISRSLVIRSIYEVPVDGREEHICDYFTHDWAFGQGFRQTRNAMQEAIEAFLAERNYPPELPGELGVTLRFLNCVSPSQAILSRTSSFRLDRIALYLSGQGAKSYFRQGLGREAEPREARRLADEVLEEVLGVYTPPEAPYRSHGRYVAAALAQPANRARADRVYLDLMRQIGTFWGTLYAAGGCSWGESFVARNVGLKSCWEKGRWRVRILFMDHDSLRIGRDRLFLPQDLLRGMWEDQRYILGDGVGRGSSGKGEAGFLEEIYRIRADVAEAGRKALRAAARRSYRKARAVMAVHPEVRPCFRRSYLRESRDWEAVMKRLPTAWRGSSRTEGWTEDIRRLLVRRKYGPSRIEPYLEFVEEYSGFLEKQLFFHHPG
jgi:hypothetical protein